MVDPPRAAAGGLDAHLVVVFRCLLGGRRRLGLLLGLLLRGLGESSFGLRVPAAERSSVIA